MSPLLAVFVHPDAKVVAILLVAVCLVLVVVTAAAARP